jgi:C_GCAxxG_C_C family probable redox protein
MRRRDFVKGCTLGSVLGGSLLEGPPTLQAADAKQQAAIDPEELAKTAAGHFAAGKRTCCESILMAGCEALGIQSDLVPDIALGLAGGVGFQGETCGVLTGSALVLSLAVAQKETQTEYPKRMMRTLEAVGRVHKAFKEEFGHSDCRSLCGLDLTTPEGRQKLKEGVRAQKCTKFVQVGARLLANELGNI